MVMPVPTRPVQYRQGDVLLTRIDNLPPTARPLRPEQERVVLAYGEVTGHAHAMGAARVCYFRDDGGRRAFIQVSGDGPTALSHEEHRTIPVEPGLYEVTQQREYEPKAQPRAIAD